ncbi:hypothetical protein EV1_027913 [Malus domestica]
MINAIIAMVPNNEQNEAVADGESLLPWSDGSEILTDHEESSYAEEMRQRDLEFLENQSTAPLTVTVDSNCEEKEAMAVEAIILSYLKQLRHEEEKEEKAVAASRREAERPESTSQLATPAASISARMKGPSASRPEFKPSSVCLAKMVQNFIEESNEKQPLSKWGQNRCNCFHGNSNDSSDDKLDIFGGGFGDSISSGSIGGDASDMLGLKKASLLWRCLSHKEE